MNEIPQEDGYYWMLLGKHNMHRVYLDEDKYTIVKISTDLYHPYKQNIQFLESGNNRWFRIKYLKDRAKFGNFIKIINPNKDL